MNSIDNPEEFMKAQEEEIRILKDANAGQQLALMQQSIPDRDSNLLQQQIDTRPLLKKIKLLLKGYERDENTGDWIPPKTDDLRVLSDYGVKMVMQVLEFYIHEHTLLSNYDEPTINAKMEDLGEELNDALFNEYDKVFLYPSTDDCKQELLNRLNKKAEIRSIAYELQGTIRDHEELKKEIIKELDGKIEKELENIKAYLMKNKLKRYPLLWKNITDAVHNVYRRSFQGMERKTLRENAFITETRGGIPTNEPPSKKNPLSWFTKNA